MDTECLKQRFDVDSCISLRLSHYNDLGPLGPRFSSSIREEEILNLG
jgi:hypothetical protein